MKLKKILIVIGCAFITTLSQAQNIKIGVVDAEKIMRDAKISKLAQDKIQKASTQREKELDTIATKGRGLLEKLQKEMASLSDNEKAKRKKELDDIDDDFRAKQAKYQEEITNLKGTELSSVVSNTTAVIKTIASQEKFDLILQDAVYVSNALDITDKVLNILNQK